MITFCYCGHQNHLSTLFSLMTTSTMLNLSHSKKKNTDQIDTVSSNCNFYRLESIDAVTPPKLNLLKSLHALLPSRQVNQWLITVQQQTNQYFSTAESCPITSAHSSYSYFL